MFYTPSLVPTTRADGLSAVIRTEYSLIGAGFDKLPSEVTLKEGRVTFCADGSSGANTIVLTAPYAVTLTAGLRLFWKAAFANTGACTVNVNALGAIALKRSDGSALASGDLPLNYMAEASYNGTEFRLASTIADISASAANAAAAASSASAASGSATTATTQAGTATTQATAASSSATSASSSATTAAASATTASNATKKLIQLVITDPRGAAIATGDGQLYFAIPPELNGTNLISPGAALKTASSSGLPTIQLRRVRAGVSADMLSTKITISATKVDSSDGATPPVIDAANDDCLTGDQIHVDIDGAGTGAIGLNVRWGFQ